MSDISQLIRDAVAGRGVEPSALEDALHTIMAGDAEPVQVAGLLVALATQAPDAKSLAAAARALRAHRVAIHPNVRPLIDTCGTGGDGAGTFNISTAAAMVVAAAGGAVAKHGNRGVSSPVGSADVLQAAGCKLDLNADRATELLDACGFVFMFAPAFHPAMAHVAPVRRSLGVRTLFNLLGPLANPALAEYQLLGVYDPAATSVMAEALLELGSKGALVVHCDGLDECGLHAVTRGHRLKDGAITEIEIDPARVGIARADVSELAGAGTAEENAAQLRESLGGTAGARSDVVALNAGAALEVAGIASDLADGVARARDCMESGAALRVLDRYAESSSR